MDTTFFKRVLGVMIFRTRGLNLKWRYVGSERLIYYIEELISLKSQLGCTFKSFTIDGRIGLVKLLQMYYPNTPIQLCQFHQMQNITKYITKRPKTECGVELRCLMLKLATIDKEDFIKQFNKLKEKYQDFLKEKNENGQFVHRNLRSAFRSIKTNLPYLFTYQDYPHLNMPNTTNSCDGSFGQWKMKVRLHRSISIQRKKQVIDTFLAHKIP